MTRHHDHTPMTYVIFYLRAMRALKIVPPIINSINDFIFADKLTQRHRAGVYHSRSR